MPQGYSIHVLAQDGHLKQRFHVVCDTDEEAKTHAERLLDGHAVEVWQATRRVVTFFPAKEGHAIRNFLPNAIVGRT